MYQRALDHLEVWLAMTFCLTLPLLLAMVSTAVDSHLADYLQYLWSHDGGKGEAGTLLSAVQDRCPALKRHLPTAWRQFSTWRYLEPGTVRSAWPVILVLAVARQASLQGLWDVCLALLVGFHCFLRPGELAALRVADVLGRMSLMGLGRPIGLIAIWSHKTSRRSAKSHHVLIENDGLLAELEGYMATLTGLDMHLFPSYADLRKTVERILVALLGKGHGFTLAGLRGGGATHHYLVHGNIEALMRKGRWSSRKTLDHYLQVAGAHLAVRHWDAKTNAHLLSLAEPWEGLLCTPT